MTLLERTVDDPSLRWRRRSPTEANVWKYKSFGERVEAAEDYNYVTEEHDRDPRPSRENAHVSLRLLYRRGALLALGVAVCSIILWLAAAAPIINPFLSVMIIIMSPFIYLMGKIERR